MDIIFKDKERVKKEYSRLFLEMTTHIDKLLESIHSRYGKMASLAQLQEFSSPKSQSLHEFIGESNQPRIRYFFGDPAQWDKRDAQFNEFDHFLLDTIHFEITYQLIMRLNSEYSSNAEEIDKGWFTPEQLKTTQIPPQFLIQNHLGTMRDSFFQELNFPAEGQVQIFTFKKHQLMLNTQLFARWLPEAAVSKSAPVEQSYGSIPLYLLLIAATSTIGAIFGFTGFLVSAAGATLVSFGLNTHSRKTNDTSAQSNHKANPDSPQVMQKLMPSAQNKLASSKEDVPLHSQVRQRTPNVEFRDESHVEIQPSL